MTNDEINSLPEQIRQGKLSVAECAWKLMTEVYLFPRRFISIPIDEDTRSNFVTHMQPKIAALLNRYDPTICPFAGYFTISINTSFISWKRKLLREKFENQILQSNSMQFYEDACEKYSDSEYSQLKFVSAKKTDYIIEPEKKLLKKPKRNLALPSKNVKSLNLYWPSKSFKQKKMLIMALKSVYYIQEDQISQVSSLCDCKKEELQEKFEYLRKELERKIERREDFLKQRDNSYFFHKRYAFALQNMQANTIEHQNMLQKYNWHTKSWIQKNKMLQKSRYKVCPSNKSIAQIFGISERQVSYYIASVKYHCNNLTEIVNQSKNQ